MSAQRVKMIIEYLYHEDGQGDLEFIDNHGVVICCGQCKFSEYSYGGWAGLRCHRFDRVVAEHDYCSWGHRKEQLNEPKVSLSAKISGV